jgi:hypothetical protein
VTGVFLSADTVHGNGSGANPYAYVGGNPETYSDPTGQKFVQPSGGGGGPSPLGGVTGGGASSNSFVLYTPSSLLIPIVNVKPSSSVIVPLSRTVLLLNSVTSCGTPGASQPLCGNYGVNFALYLSTGGEIGVPGSWCLECGSGGGSNNSRESGSCNDLLASDTEEGALGEAGGGAAGDPEGETPPVEPLLGDQGVPVNRFGHPYPTVIDPRTGESMPFPECELQVIPQENRVEWPPQGRQTFIEEWNSRGYPEPKGGWDRYDIHHILPTGSLLRRGRRW